jgi:hypothetical protein
MLKSKIYKKDELDEFINADGGIIQGDRNVTSNSEIETGPVQKPFNDTSDYEKGVSTTTDRATRYRQNIPWFAVYSYRSSSGRGLPINETGDSKIVTKNQIESKIKEDLVKKTKNDGEVRGKDYDVKTEKLIDMIEDDQLNDEQLKKLKTAVLNKINSKNG